MPFVDFAELKTRVSITDAAQKLCLAFKPHGDQLRAPCPACNQGGDRAIVLTPAKNLFYCFPSKVGGDCIQLVAHVKGIKVQEAAQLLSDGVISTAPAAQQNRTLGSQRPQNDKAGDNRPTFDPAAYAARLDPAHEALKELGISAETLAAFKCGYASTGLNRGRLALPIHDQEGRIVAYCGRALDAKEPRLTFPQNFDAQSFVFNWHQVHDNDLAYLCRDPLDVLRAAEGGIDNAVAVLGPMTATFLQVLSLWCEERNIHSVEPM